MSGEIKGIGLASPVKVASISFAHRGKRDRMADHLRKEGSASVGKTSTRNYLQRAAQNNR
jgi:hypothetical protein